MECKVLQVIQLQDREGNKVPSWLTLGEVVAVYIDRSLIKDGVYQTADAHPILRADGWAIMLKSSRTSCLRWYVPISL